MTDDIKAIRDALATGPTPGPWKMHRSDYRADDGGRSSVHANVYSTNRKVSAAAICGQKSNRVNGRTEQRMADLGYIAACHPERIARLLDALEAARAALSRIAELDPEIDSEEGYNEWGEADFFNQAQKIARAALSPPPPAVPAHHQPLASLQPGDDAA